MGKSIEDILTLGEIVQRAHENASPEAWDYMIGGSETETTLRRNRLALDELAFRPRVLRDVSHIDTYQYTGDASVHAGVFCAYGIP